MASGAETTVELIQFVSSIVVVAIDVAKWMVVSTFPIQQNRMNKDRDHNLSHGIGQYFAF